MQERGTRDAEREKALSSLSKSEIPNVSSI